MTDSTKDAVRDEGRKHFENLENHNFHDATLEDVRLVPVQAGEEKARLEMTLSYPHVELRFQFTFLGCTNISAELDLDVLAENLPYTTAFFESERDEDKIRDFILSQIPSWNVSYDDVELPSSAGYTAYSSGPSPLAPKLARVSTLSLHKVVYFGGLLSVVAESYKIELSDFQGRRRQLLP